MPRRDGGRGRRRFKGLPWPEGRRALIPIFALGGPPAADGRPGAGRRFAGAAAPAHVLILKEVRAAAGRPGQKRGPEPGRGGQGLAPP